MSWIPGSGISIFFGLFLHVRALTEIYKKEKRKLNYKRKKSLIAKKTEV